MKIRKVINGYVLERTSWGNEEVYTTLDEVFRELLQHFEGRCKSFGGDMYGKVTIERERPSEEKLKSKEEQAQTCDTCYYWGYTSDEMGPQLTKHCVAPLRLGLLNKECPMMNRDDFCPPNINKWRGKHDQEKPATKT